jgi:tRNA pseudouridine55 synthase
MKAPVPKAKGTPEMGRRGKKKGRPVSGWLVLDKPLGISDPPRLSPRSSGLYKADKAGHAGTLDPLASGMSADRAR